MVLRGARSVCRMSVVALLSDQRVRLIPERPGPQPDDDVDTAATALLGLNAQQLAQVNDRAGHVREVLSGHRLGHPEAALPGEPRRKIRSGPAVEGPLPGEGRGVRVDCRRTVRRWVRAFREHGEAGCTGRGAGCDPGGSGVGSDGAGDCGRIHRGIAAVAPRNFITGRGWRGRSPTVVEPSRPSAYRKLVPKL